MNKNEICYTCGANLISDSGNGLVCSSDKTHEIILEITSQFLSVVHCRIHEALKSFDFENIHLALNHFQLLMIKADKNVVADFKHKLENPFSGCGAMC